MIAFVLPGGGVRTCKQVGMLKALFDKGIYPDRLYGVSGGAKNAWALSLMARYASDRPGWSNWQYAIEMLGFEWLDLTSTSDVLRKRSLWSRFWGLSGGWGGKKSQYSSLPLREMLQRIWDEYGPSSQGGELGESCFTVPTTIGLVNLSSGEYERRENPTVEEVLASSSMPGFMSPIQMGDDWYADGGARHIAPINDAISDRCDKIYVLLATTPGAHRIDFQPKTQLDVVGRFASILADEVYADDLGDYLSPERIRTGPTGPGMHIIAPTHDYFDSFMDIDPAKIRHGIAHGERVAREYLG